MNQARAAIVGTGNIGTDLLFKLLRSDVLRPRYMVGIDPQSEGLRRAAEQGVATSHEGVEWLLSQPDCPEVIFEATSAHVHQENARLYAEAGVRAVDLTPAAVGPYVVPAVNLGEHSDAPNVNLITCGGQATIPMVAAVSRVTPVAYAEIVASIASRSAGPGTRANIDEFTRTTSRGIERVGGAAMAKAIIILNPAHPPLLMRNTVYCEIAPDADRSGIVESIAAMEAEVQRYVPGYRRTAEPQFDDEKVTILLEVAGAGDYLPTFAGNLDIMTSAAVRVGELLVGAPAVAS